MIETILSFGIGVVVLGVVIFFSFVLHDSRMDKLEAEKYRQSVKHNFP